MRRNRIHILFWGVLAFLCIPFDTYAQVGDDFQDAIEITIPNQGYGTGLLSSPVVPFDQKTTVVGQKFCKPLF